MDSNWITWIIQGLTGLAVGAIGYFMKRDRAAQDARIDKQERRIDDLEKDMKQLPYVFTTREDFIRAVASLETKMASTENKLDSKLDKVLDRIASIKEEA